MTAGAAPRRPHGRGARGAAACTTACPRPTSRAWKACSNCWPARRSTARPTCPSWRRRSELTDDELLPRGAAPSTCWAWRASQSGDLHLTLLGPPLRRRRPRAAPGAVRPAGAASNVPLAAHIRHSLEQDPERALPEQPFLRLLQQHLDRPRPSACSRPSSSGAATARCSSTTSTPAASTCPTTSRTRPRRATPSSSGCDPAIAACAARRRRRRVRDQAAPNAVRRLLESRLSAPPRRLPWSLPCPSTSPPPSPPTCIPSRACAWASRWPACARPTARTWSRSCSTPARVVAGVFTQNRFCAAPVQVCREHLAGGGADGQDGIRALVINTGNANAGTGADGLARARRTCEAAAGLLGLEAAAGAAVLHRRHHGDAAGRAHRGRPAGRARRPGRRALGAGGRRHHDHRHAAQGRVDAGDDRRQDRHRHRHQQGRRHDPPEHGHDAGLPRHRRGDLRAAAAGAREAGGRRVVQPHHDRRRHLHQRQLRRDGHAAGRPRAHRLAGVRRRPRAGRAR